MLRLVVLLLLLANGAFFAWSQGLLIPWGAGPVQQSESQRLAQQVRPEALRIVSAEEARRIEIAAPASRPPECLQSGLLEDSAVDDLRQVLQGWPPGAWSMETMSEPARWIVYMGKFQTPESMNRKKAELRQLRVSFEAVSNAALEPGLSLGGFASQNAATQQMESLSERGVRTARVVQERAEVRGQRVLLPAVDDALRLRLDELRGALNGKPLRPCR